MYWASCGGDRVLGKVKKVIQVLRNPKAEVIETTDPETVSLNERRFLEMMGANPDPDGVDVRGKKALKEVTVFTCVKILSEAMGKLPIKIYQDQDGVRKAIDHRLYRLLKLRPNPFMSSTSMMRCLEVQRNIYGNAYASIEFDRKGNVIGLWPIDNDKGSVEMWIDDAGILGPSGALNPESKMWYVVTVNGERRKVLPSSILHLKAFSADGISGVSPLRYLKTMVENAASSGKFINKFFKKGLQSKGLVHYTGDLSHEAKQRFIKNFEEMSSGLKNAHRVAMLPFGYQFTPIALPLTDAQFLENTELTIRQIAAAFGIKMHQLNELARATHTNITEQQRQFYVDTLLPIITEYEQELTWKLFLPDELEAGFYVRFNVDVILRADMKTRFTAYQTGIQSGFLKPNEAREKEELPPDPNGDRLLINGNMMPIEKAGAQYDKGTGNREPSRQKPRQ
jgi:HK97 family phage portal protein